jgi:selenocysteine lyase/cysteine desulfurase
MPLARRELLARTGAALAAGTIGASAGWNQAAAQTTPQVADVPSRNTWDNVRAQFALSDEYIHLSAMLIASHPKPVRDAIEEHRRAMDANPLSYLFQNNRPLQEAARAAAGQYLAVNASDIALTDSTTMGVSLVYNGLRLTPDQEILTTEQDYYVTHEAVRLAAKRTGASVRKVSLYDSIDGITAEQIVERIIQAVTPATRVVALTWVHSSTGLKLPLRLIADRLEQINAGRNESARVLLCVDGVHGFGVEDVVLSDLGCDFFIAGCHKWLFGPRGTGIIAGTRRGWDAVLPTIPSFIDGEMWQAWFSGTEPAGPTTGSRMTPGGYKAFEHLWALPQAFAFHQESGKTRVAERTHELAGHLKDGLAAMSHVALQTPRSNELSAGIVSFDVAGFSPAAVVRHLRERRIVASVAPYAVPHVRLTPCVQNTRAEIATVLRELQALAS